MRRAHILGTASELVILMTSLARSSFSSATISVQHHHASAYAEVAPWRGILAVEPDSAVLSAKTLVLTRANYFVTPATGLGDLFSLRNTKEFALAILSDGLGERSLGTVAATVRRQWPRIRILILGQVPRVLDDHLYDEQIRRSSDDQQILADLEWLYEGMWNERSKSIDWNASRSALSSTRQPIPESDPTKASLLRRLQANPSRHAYGHLDTSDEGELTGKRWNDPPPRKTSIVAPFM